MCYKGPLWYLSECPNCYRCLRHSHREYRATVKGTDGLGGVFVQGSYISRDSGTFRRITLDQVKASGRSAWGAMTVDKESRLLFYHSVKGKCYTCSYLSKEQPVELVIHDSDSIIAKQFSMRTEEAIGRKNFPRQWIRLDSNY